MKRQIAAFTFVLLLFLTACGGGEAPASSGSSSSADISQEESPPAAPTPFTLAVYPEFSFHPALAASRANLTLAPLLYEPLFQVDGFFQAQPVLCRSYTVSEDKLVWTFTLRGGITFSDGTPLTGETAAAALELARGTGSRYAKRLAGVAGIAGEGGSVTITLRRPSGSLPLLLDIPLALGDGERPAGTGPYVLAGEGEGLSLTARENWWQRGEKTLPISAIPLHKVSRSDELIYAFDAGDVSLVDVDLMATNAMGYGGNYQTWDYSTTEFLYLGLNTRNGVCRDPQVRRLLAMAVDRNAIASTVYAGHAMAAALPVHPSSGLYSQTAAAAPEARPAAAEALFARLSDQVPIVPIAFKNGSVLTQWGKLSRLSPVRGNVFYQMENWTVK